jgi:hypothetical protein
MTLLASAITRAEGIRLAEVGELLGLIGGIALLVGALTRFGNRAGPSVGGVAIALGFLLLIIATHWGHFH